MLPTPKYDEEQEGYHNYVSPHIMGLISIPITSYGNKLSETGMILEALAAESYYTIIPQYIETTLQSKYVRRPEDAEMVRLVIENTVYDPMTIYDFGGFGVFFDCDIDNDHAFASKIERYKKLVNASITQTTEKLIEKSEEAALAE